MISSLSIRVGVWTALAAAVGAMPFISASSLRAQGATTVSAALVHSFATGEVPSGNLANSTGVIQGSDGNFYGTTQTGGANGKGSVFRLTPAGVLTTLYSFSTAGGGLATNADGTLPGSLVQGSDGNLYGVTVSNGPHATGTFFRVTQGGAFTVLHSFDALNASGVNVEGNGTGSLVEGGDGSFYGVAVGGGINNTGTVFKISTAGQITVLHTFSTGTRNGTGYFVNTEGAGPTALTRGADGDFYGTAQQGGPNGTGTLFRVTPAGVLTVLHSFAANSSSSATSNSDGINPLSGLAQGPGGELYGTTVVGGANQCGTIFKVTTNGTFTLLHDFTAAEVGNGGTVTALGGRLVLGNDGNFYGTISDRYSSGNGSIFRLTPAGDYANVYTFTSPTGSNSAGNATNAEGLYPISNIIQGSDGAFYGSTYIGGPTGLGTIFKLTVPGVHPSFFDGETALDAGVYYLAFASGNPFSYYSYLADQRYIYHFDLGYEYVFDAFDGKDGVYLYDFKSGGFLYTSPAFPFPYLYDFSLNSVLYYFPDPDNPGRYNTNGVRYFYNFATGEIISK